MTRDAGERIARLYGLPLEEFTAERNALAAELRREGDPEAAARVKSMRKPSAAAWAVNRLARSEPDLVEALLGAGGELRQAHRQAASGKGAAQLRAAAEAERAAVEALMTAAPAVLGRVPAPALADAMRNTLHAASSDDSARSNVAAGTLVDALRPVGLGPVPRDAAKAAVSASRRPPADAGRRVEEKARAAEAAERAREVKAAVAEETAFQREVDAAARALERAEEAYTRARETAEAAAERAKDARKRLRQAKAGLADAARARARLERG